MTTIAEGWESYKASVYAPRFRPVLRLIDPMLVGELAFKAGAIWMLGLLNGSGKELSAEEIAALFDEASGT